MKKYWKAIVTSVVVVLAIGTFYVTSAMSAAAFPEFVIQKQKGDASLVDSVRIRGSYEQKDLFKPLEITANGTVYNSEKSLIDQLKNNHQPIIRNLIKKHRGFMRGKNETVDSFFENDRYLAYANVDYHIRGLAPRDYKLSIALLDKKEGTSSSYKIPVPNGSDYSSVPVQDVQIIDGKLKIITRNYDKKNTQEIHIYTIDPVTKKLIGDKTALSAASSPDSFTDIQMVNEGTPIQSHQYVIFNEMVVREIGQGQTEQQTQHTLLAYNLVTGEKKKITLPEKLKKLVSTPKEINPALTFDGSNLYFIKTGINKIVVTPYNVENENTGSINKIQVQNRKGIPEQPFVAIQNGDLYTLSSYRKRNSSAVLTVVDLKSGDVRYKGKIVEKNPSSNKRTYKLFFHQMIVQ